MVNADHAREPSSSSTGGHDIVGDNADFIMMDDLVQDMVDGGGKVDGEPAVLEPKDVEPFEELINCLNNEHVMFGSLRWLDNF
jgi:hypothetical protein